MLLKDYVVLLFYTISFPDLFIYFLTLYKCMAIKLSDLTEKAGRFKQEANKLISDLPTCCHVLPSCVCVDLP